MSAAPDPERAWLDTAVEGLTAWTDLDDATRAVGLIDRDHQRIVTSADHVAGERFGIGSITKTMTATVLVHLHLTGVLDVDDPIGGVLDAGANGEITFLQLAMHTSGLPRLAPNMHGEGYDPIDPYAHQTAGDIRTELRECPRTVTTEPEYSNFGYAVLALAVEAVTESDWPTLYQRHLWGPLGMDATTLRTPATDNLVPGRFRGRPVQRWTKQVPGAGGVETTVDDLLRYVRAALAPNDDEVGRAIAATTNGLVGTADGPIAWQATVDGLLWHNGGEAGVSSMAIMDRPARRAVVSLAALSDDDDLGLAAVDALRDREVRRPVGDPPVEHPAWTMFERAVDAMRRHDLDGLAGLLAPTYRADEAAMASIQAELTDDIGQIPEDARILPLPGRPPAATVRLDDQRELYLLADATGETVAVFMVIPAGSVPPW